MNVKTCYECGIAYPATPEFFQRDCTNRDGLQSQCKPCRYELERRRNNRPYRIFQHKANTANQRAAAIGAAGKLYGEDLHRQLKAQRGKCYWCGDYVGRGWHVDHIHDLAHSLNNAPSNVVCSCAACNLAKGAQPLQHWLSRLASSGVYHPLAAFYGINAVQLPLFTLEHSPGNHRGALLQMAA